MSKYKYVLLGNSAAAISAAEAIRTKDKQGSIAIVSAEDTPPYSPALTTYYISGAIGKDKIYYRPKEFYKKLNIETFLGKAATEIDRSKKTVRLADGQSLTYDKLLISIGGLPIEPDLPGVNLKGVFTLRTLEDAEKIKQRAAEVKNAVILGGGLVGLRSAYALHQLGLNVTIIVSSKRILSQNLDAEAAKIMENWLREKHFEILTETDVKALEGTKEVTKIKLMNGKEIPAGLVIIGKGVRPNISFAKACGIETDRGILVNEAMQTSDKNIYAAGDVAQGLDKLLGKKVVNAIWPAATEQGCIAGLNMAGASEKYEGSIPMNSVDFYGLSALSIGISNPRNEADYEIQVTKEPARHIYRKLVLQKDVLVGAILVGDIDRAGIITGLIDEKVRVTNFKDTLLKNKFGLMVLPKALRDSKIAQSAKG